MTSPLRIGVAGLGTVGAGVIKIIEQRAENLKLRTGREIIITAVSARDREKDRGVSVAGFTWHDNAIDLASDPNVDVVLELIGGSDGIAKTLCETALANGKHVVTANKALIAHHGTSLALLAEGKNLAISYEAAVAGGIPIIKAMREGLSANGITRVYGILNGTCNYILTAMSQSGEAFDDILSDAQARGYAEADPAFDVDGIDSAHKLAILASVAFGSKVNFDAVYTQGIRNIMPIDIQFARELGYGIKLLGIAELTGDGIKQRVHPCMVPLEAPINHVNGVFNAVVADGNFVDTTIYEGRGAGEGPTASAVIADVIDIARGNILPTFAIPAISLGSQQTLPMEQHRGAYYIRFMVVDKPGVFADIAASLQGNDVSMEQVIQRSRAPGEAVPVVMTVHDTQESSMQRCLNEIGALEAVVEPPSLIRIEML